jgi:hypothetical protein
MQFFISYILILANIDKLLKSNFLWYNILDHHNYRFHNINNFMFQIW